VALPLQGGLHHRYVSLIFGKPNDIALDSGPSAKTHAHAGRAPMAGVGGLGHRDSCRPYIEACDDRELPRSMALRRHQRSISSILKRQPPPSRNPGISPRFANR
jgi:hypothetical protein